MPRPTVLLIYPHHRYFYLEYPWLPLASLFLSSTLVEAGYRTIIIDDRFTREKTLQQIAEHIDDTALIAFTTACGSQLKNTVELIDEIRNDHAVPIVLGGSFPSAEPELCLRELPVDYVIVGQGEHQLLKLANHLTGEGKREDIANLHWKSDAGDIHKSILKHQRVDIDRLPPLPIFNTDVIDVKRYLHPVNRAINYNTSTGCVGRCGFCYWPASYSYSHFRTERILADLVACKKHFNIKMVEFQDPILFFRPERTRRLARGLIDAGLNIKWRGNARVDTMDKYTDDDFRLIKSAGCYYIYLGLESGSPNMLKMMNKRLRTDNLPRIVKSAQRHDIKILIFLLFGLPGETLAHLKESALYIRHLLSINPDLEFAYSFFTPYPGCEMTRVANVHWKPPSSITEYSQLERSHSLTENDREPLKLRSPWEEDYFIPWFSEDFYREYMDYWRKNIPQNLSLTSVDGRKKDYYRHNSGQNEPLGAETEEP